MLQSKLFCGQENSKKLLTVWTKDGTIFFYIAQSRKGTSTHNIAQKTKKKLYCQNCNKIRSKLHLWIDFKCNYFLIYCINCTKDCINFDKFSIIFSSYILVISYFILIIFIICVICINCNICINCIISYHFIFSVTVLKINHFVSNNSFVNK